MPSLFMVMLGGRHARANTEVHDVVMAVGDTLEEVYPQANKLGLVRLKDYILMLGLSSQELVLRTELSNSFYRCCSTTR